MLILKMISMACCSVALLTFTACHKDPDADKCIADVQASVSQVTGPTTGAVNQDINLLVSFPCYNGCGQFGRFDKNILADTTTIKVIARYEGCICTQDVPTRTATYSFRATQPGNYHLKFFQTQGTYLVHSIIIQ